MMVGADVLGGPPTRKFEMTEPEETEEDAKSGLEVDGTSEPTPAAPVAETSAVKPKGPRIPLPSSLQEIVGALLFASESPLTAAELQVLRLMCADKSNAEIGQIMDVKLTTVKTHVSHILDKLGVSRRSEAKTAAKKLWLIPEDL